jgi:hypothetical protein
MTMDPIFLQPGDIAPLSLPATLPASNLPAIAAPAAPIPEICPLDRISRLAALDPEDTVAGLLWLAMNFPAACDAMLDKTEFDAVDDEDPCQEPEPFCAECGASIGIFLRHGTNWRHYLGDNTVTGQVEMFDPGHDPVVAWRMSGLLATR